MISIGKGVRYSGLVNELATVHWECGLLYWFERHSWLYWLGERWVGYIVINQTLQSPFISLFFYIK